MRTIPLARHNTTRRPAAVVSRYGLAVASVGLALLVTVALNHPEIRGPLFIPAILLSAWYGGTGPGLLAVGLSVLGIDYFLGAPRYTLHFLSFDDALYLFVFSVSALFAAWLAGVQRRTSDALSDAHAVLTTRLQDLERSNERLHAEVIERERAEAEVRKQASLLDLTHDTVFVRDTHDVITYWNAGAAELYGWSKGEAVGAVSHELTRTVFPAPLEEIEAELHRAGRWEGELLHRKRDGTQIVVASRWSAQWDEQGQLAGVLETNNDVTERKHAQEALQRAQGELARVTRLTMLGEITASIAHEVNQPLAAVVMNGNACRRWLAADPPNVAEAREAAQRVVNDGTRAGQVIARVRALVQRGTPERSALDINEVIQETVGFTRNELERHAVRLRTELRDDLPQVMGDHVQLQQVLMNLILNGVDAMAEVRERPRVLTITSRLEGSDNLVIEVKDCGKGLSPEHADRIFDPFFSTKAGGLGMGLSISRSIVEQHGGKIVATPNNGPGLTMQVSLPAASGAEKS